METRTIQQVKIYYLAMNPVTDRAETVRIAMMSSDKERLINMYNNEIVDSYDDDRFRKVFRKGGPLEWYNPLFSLEQPSSFNGEGLLEDWVDMENIGILKTKYYFI